MDILLLLWFYVDKYYCLIIYILYLGERVNKKLDKEEVIWNSGGEL